VGAGKPLDLLVARQALLAAVRVFDYPNNLS
jgi:hypothetical protein